MDRNRAETLAATLGIGFVSAVTVVLYSTASMGGIATAFGLVSLGVWAGWWLHHRQTLRQAHREKMLSETAESRIAEWETYAHELERINVELLPILSRHVQSSRDLAEANVGSLTARFTGIAERLHHVIASSQNADTGSEVDHRFANSRKALTQVVQSLKSLLERKSVMVAQVRSLSDDVNALESMAVSVRSVAEQINVLALNAAIEAARAGHHGRGFAVVADEVRKLAAISSHAGEQISEKIQPILTSMDQTLDLVESTNEQDDRMIETAESTIREVLTGLQKTVDTLHDDAGSLRQSSEQINSEITEVMVALQFQDRLNQHLQHVQNSLTEMEQAVRESQNHPGGNQHQDLLRIDDLLQKMIQECSTQAGLDRHHGQGTLGHKQAASELTFF